MYQFPLKLYERQVLRLKLNPNSCSMYPSSLRTPFKKVDFTSIWWILHLCWTAMQERLLVLWSLVERPEQTLHHNQSQPFDCNLLQLALPCIFQFLPWHFCFVLYTHLTPISLCPFGREMSSHVLFFSMDLISSSITSLHLLSCTTSLELTC